MVGYFGQEKVVITIKIMLKWLQSPNLVSLMSVKFDFLKFYCTIYSILSFRNAGRHNRGERERERERESEREREREKER